MNINNNDIKANNKIDNNDNNNKNNREGHLLNNLWSDVMEFVFEELYLPAVEEEEEG